MSTTHPFYSAANQGTSGLLDSKPNNRDVFVLLLTDVNANDSGALLRKGNYIEMQKDEDGHCRFKLYPDPENVTFTDKMVAMESVPGIVKIKDLVIKPFGTINDAEWKMMDNPPLRMDYCDEDNGIGPSRVVTLVRINPEEKHIPAVPRLTYKH